MMKMKLVLVAAAVSVCDGVDSGTGFAPETPEVTPLALMKWAVDII